MVITVDIGNTKILIYPDFQIVTFIFYFGRTATLTIAESIAVMQELAKEGRGDPK